MPEVNPPTVCGAVQYLTCFRWFRSRGGLAVHRPVWPPTASHSWALTFAPSLSNVEAGSCGCFTAAKVQDRIGWVSGCVCGGGGGGGGGGGEHWLSSGWDKCLQHYGGCEIAGVSFPSHHPPAVFFSPSHHPPTHPAVKHNQWFCPS